MEAHKANATHRWVAKISNGKCSSGGPFENPPKWELNGPFVLLAWCKRGAQVIFRLAFARKEEWRLFCTFEGIFMACQWLMLPLYPHTLCTWLNQHVDLVVKSKLLEKVLSSAFVSNACVECSQTLDEEGSCPTLCTDTSTTLNIHFRRITMEDKRTSALSEGNEKKAVLSECSPNLNSAAHL